MEKNNKKIFKIIFSFVVFVSALSLFFVFNNQRPVGQVESSEINIVKNLKIIFFDVGQGDSALIITPSEKTILIDGGPDNTVVQKLGAYLPFWRRDIDLVVLSHPHADHLVGLNEVLKRYQVKKILMTGVLHTTYEYQEWLSQINNQKIPIEFADQLKDLAFDAEIQLKILYPNKDLSAEKFENLNNSSIVLKVIYGQSSILFTGDLESDYQNNILDSNLAATILKFPHHGSSDALSEDFLDKVLPKFVVISAGENNFGQPSRRVIKFLERLGTMVLVTRESGDIIFKCDLNRCFTE